MKSEKLKAYFILILEEYGGKTHNLEVFESIEALNNHLKAKAKLYGISKTARIKDPSDVIACFGDGKLKMDYFVYKKTEAK